jgi:hypothetical protein
MGEELLDEMMAMWSSALFASTRLEWGASSVWHNLL